MTTITREQAQKIIDAADEVITALAGTNEDVHPESDSILRLWDDLNDRYAPPEVVRELARIALASLEAEPVAYNQVQRDMMKDIIVRKMGGNLAGKKLVMDDIHAVTMALIDAGFRTAQPASEREQIRREHAEWSDATFGDVGPIGPLKHLSKEALEAAAEPDDLSEWADMQFLLWDAQRRAGITDEQITQAMVEKLAVNKQREWPEPKDGEPRLHIKEQTAPVVPEEIPKGLAGQIVSLLAHNIGDKFLAQKIWNACRAALLQGSQPVSNHDELPYAQVKAVADLYALCWQSGEVVTYTPDPEKATIWLNNYSGTSVQEYVNLERLQEDTKHGLLEVAIARFSKMNEGFPIKRFKADLVISWMLENFPPVAQKQGDN